MSLRLVVPWLLLLATRPAPAASQPSFTDVTRQAGVAFRNWFGDNDAKTILETTGTGAAFCDYDGDGDLDIYLVNGAVGFDSPRFRDLPHDVVPPADGLPPRNGLFRNGGNGIFTETARQAGVDHTGWGQGCVCADYDNDGHLDLFVTYYGPNVLYRNSGHATFADVSATAGVDDPRYGTATAFGDYDNDGRLDLFVGNYVDFDPETTLLPGEVRGKAIGAMRGIPTMASPEAFAGQPDILYHNAGDGTFRDVSAAVGLNPGPPGRALGAVFWDYDDDGDQDLFVANDAMANFLYTNRGDGTFAEDGLERGLAYDAEGHPEGSMGVAVGDVDNDGWQDLVVTNFEGQTTSLHHNDGGTFSDISVSSGLFRYTLQLLQWGAVLFDWDNDGDSDLFLASGHLTSALEGHYPESAFAQKDQLFRNDGGVFTEVTARAGPGLQVAFSSRGVAAGDYDDDGDEDLLVVHKNDFPSLLRNDGGNANRWLQVRARGTRSNRDGVGAKIRVAAGGRSQTKEVRAGSSYLSHNSLWLSFGLGQHTAAETLEVRWPSGSVQRFAGVPANRIVTADEGAPLLEMR